MIIGLSILAYCVIGFIIAMAMRVKWIKRNPYDRDLDFNTEMLLMFWPFWVVCLFCELLLTVVMFILLIITWPFIKTVEHVDKVTGRPDTSISCPDDVGLPVVENE